MGPHKHKAMTLRQIFILLLTICLLPAKAQVVRTTLFGVGHGHLLDTYLSPYSYGGASASVGLQTERTAHWGGEHVSVMGLYEVRGAMASSRVSGAMQYAGALTAAGGWHYNWHLADNRLHLAAGGLMEVRGGGTYCTIGGNNPGQAHLGADLAASLIGEYCFPVRDKMWQTRLQIDAPLIGALFSPQYGQSYYELFTLGHYDHNVRPSYPGNAPSLRLQATVSIPVRHSSLVLGYGADVSQSHINGIRYHSWYNQLLVGFTRRLWLTR